MCSFENPFRRETDGMYWPIEKEDSYIYPKAKQSALDVLEDALSRCRNQNMRTGEVRAALDYLQGWMAKPYPCENFWRGLSAPDPHDRYIRVKTALGVIRQECGGHREKSHY